MNTLPPLPAVTRLSKNVVRILGGNPGKYTLQGTNTYLIGPPTSLLLLDTAQSSPSYIPSLQQALTTLFPPTPPPRITQILLSHYHADHTGGLLDVLEMCRKMGMGEVAVGKWRVGEGEKWRDEEIEERLKGGGWGELEYLSEGQVFPLETGEGVEVEGVKVVHTPGHTSDSFSLFLNLEEESALFTADLVLGHGTAIFEDLGLYMRSLERCIDLLEAKDQSIANSNSNSEEKSSVATSTASRKYKLYCGHGETVEDGIAKLTEYRKHRMEREEDVLRCLRSDSEGTNLPDGAGGHVEGVTAGFLTSKIYPANLPIELIPAATRGITLHLEKLLLDSKVRVVRGTSLVGVEKIDLEVAADEEKETDRWYLVDGGGRNVGGKGKI